MRQKNLNNEIDILTLQIILSVIFILTNLFSIFSTYNELSNLKYGKRIVSSKEIAKLTKLNRIIGFLILIGFLYINFKTRKFDQDRNRNTEPDDLSIIASFFSIISGLITLYIAFEYGEVALASGENLET